MGDEDDESYYEEIITDDDGDSYIEEIIEDDFPLSRNGMNNLIATQEQVDRMDLQSAKKYLMALPNAKGPTSTPVRYSDDDYEYEEIEIPDSITPIRKSQRFSFFESPALDAIVEGSEHTERSTGSAIRSPTTSQRKSLDKMSNIREDLELNHSLPVLAEVGSKPTPPGERSDEQGSAPLPEGTILIGNLNDTEERAQVEFSGKSSKAISTKSLQSSGTASTFPDSENSLDIGQVFNLSNHPTSPGSPDPPATSKSSRRSSRHENGESSTSHQGLDKHLADDKDRTSRNSSGDERSTGSSKSSKSRRRTSSTGRRSSRSSKTTEDRAQSVEAEIQQLLSPSSSSVHSSKKTSSLDAMLASSKPSTRSSDDRSRASRRSKSRERGDRSSKSGDKERRGSKRPGREPAASSSTKNDTKAKSKPTLAEQSKTLDALLARIPEGPTKKSDARSTVSALVRSTRGRKRNGGSSQSVVPTSSENSEKRTRARSARRTKKSDDEVSVPSKTTLTRRSRSSSVGRRERLRRSRQQEEAEKSKLRAREEKAPKRSSIPSDPTAPHGSSSSADKRSSRRSPSPSSRKTSSRRSPSPSSRKNSSRRSASPSPRKLAARRDRSQSPSPRKNSSRKPSSSKSLSKEPSSSRSGGRRKTTTDALDDLKNAPREQNRRASTDFTGSPVQRTFSGGSSDGIRHSRTSLHSSTNSGNSNGSSEWKFPSSRSPPGRSPSENSKISPGKTEEILKRIDAKLDQMDCESSFSRTLMLARSLNSQQESSDEEDGERSRDPNGKSSGRAHVEGDSGRYHGSGQTRLSTIANDLREAPRTPTAERRRSIHRRNSGGSAGSADMMSPVTPGSRRGRRPPKRSKSNKSRRTPNNGEKRASIKSLASPSSEKVRTSPFRSRSDYSKSPSKTGRSRSNHRSRPPAPVVSPLGGYGTDLPTMVSLPETSFDLESQQSTLSSGSLSRMKAGRSYSGDLSDFSKNGPPLTSSDVSLSHAAPPSERLKELEKIKEYLTQEEYEYKKREILSAL